jgi:hypothetical protein
MLIASLIIALFGVSEPRTTVGFLYELNCGSVSIGVESLRLIRNCMCLSEQHTVQRFAVVSDSDNHERYTFDAAGNRLALKLLNEIGRGLVHVRIEVEGEIDAATGFSGTIKVHSIKLHTPSSLHNIMGFVGPYDTSFNHWGNCMVPFCRIPVVEKEGTVAVKSWLLTSRRCLFFPIPDPQQKRNRRRGKVPCLQPSARFRRRGDLNQ